MDTHLGPHRGGKVHNITQTLSRSILTKRSDPQDTVLPKGFEDHKNSLMRVLRTDTQLDHNYSCKVQNIPQLHIS